MDDDDDEKHIHSKPHITFDQVHIHSSSFSKKNVSGTSICRNKWNDIFKVNKNCWYDKMKLKTWWWQWWSWWYEENRGRKNEEWRKKICARNYTHGILKLKRVTQKKKHFNFLYLERIFIWFVLYMRVCVCSCYNSFFYQALALGDFFSLCHCLDCYFY